MPRYTLEQLRATARSKDNRLENIQKYSNEWIDDKIDHAFETCESGRATFTNEEVVDLRPFAQDGVEKFTLEMDEEVHKHYDLISTHPSYVSVNIENDDTLSVVIDVDAIMALPDDEEISITSKYFYYPHVPFEDIFMKSEIYHFWRHCLYVNIYGSLRDKENEVYHQEQVDRFIADGSFGIPTDFDDYIEMNPNFVTHGSSQWQ